MLMRVENNGVCMSIKSEIKEEIKRGDILLVDLSPVRGSEQGGVRPALVVQNDMGNRHSTTIIVAAITTKTDKCKLPTHVKIPKKLGLFRRSVALMEQLRTVDKSRIVKKLGHADEKTMQIVDEALLISIGVKSCENFYLKTSQDII